RREKCRAGVPARQRLPRPEIAALHREAGPLPAVRQMGDGGKSHRRFSRLSRLPGMAQARRPLFRFAAGGGARQSGAEGVLIHASFPRKRESIVAVGAILALIVVMGPRFRGDDCSRHALTRSTLAIRFGTPNSRRQTSAKAATPARMASWDGLAKHNRVRLLP